GGRGRARVTLRHRHVVHAQRRRRRRALLRHKSNEDRVVGAGVEVGDVGEGAGHLHDVAGPGADYQCAVGGDVDVVGVAEHEGGARAAVEGHALLEDAASVEAGDDVVPGGGEDIPGGVDRDAAVVAVGQHDC